MDVICKWQQPANFRQGCNKTNEENPMQRFSSRIAMVVVVYASGGPCSLGGWPPALVHAAAPLCQETPEAAHHFWGSVLPEQSCSLGLKSLTARR